MNSVNTSSSSAPGTANDGTASSSAAWDSVTIESIASSEETKSPGETSSGASHSCVEVLPSSLRPLQQSELREKMKAPPVTHQTCNRCGEWKPLTTFVMVRARRGGPKFRNPMCNACRVRREKNTPLNQERWAMVMELKSQPCRDCGKTFPEECMDLDHVRGKKAFAISSHWRRVSPQALALEIAKCEPVCANCHRIRTKRRGYLDNGAPIKTASLAEVPRGGLKSEPAQLTAA